MTEEQLHARRSLITHGPRTHAELSSDHQVLILVAFEHKEDLVVTEADPGVPGTHTSALQSNERAKKSDRCCICGSLAASLPLRRGAGAATAPPAAPDVRKGKPLLEYISVLSLSQSKITTTTTKTPHDINHHVINIAFERQPIIISMGLLFHNKMMN